MGKQRYCLFIHMEDDCARWAYHLPSNHWVQQASNNKAFMVHLRMHRYNCQEATVSSLSRLQRFPPLLKHTGTIRIGPKYSRILSSDSGDEIKIAHFLSPCKEQINFPRLGRDIFLPLGFPVSGTAAWLAAGGGSGPDCTPRRRTVTSAAASLFAPRYENCHHLPFPNTSQKEKK